MIFELTAVPTSVPVSATRWVKCMEEEIIPFQVRWAWSSSALSSAGRRERVRLDPARFESEPERKALYDLVYQSDYWKNEISRRVRP